MKIKFALITLGVVLGTTICSAQTSITADQIMDNYQSATAIENLHSTLAYKNISKKGKVQERKLEQYILKNENGEDTYNFLLRFVAPNDVKNTATLTIQHDEKDDDQWLYLPVIRSAKKISASKKSDRFMGTEMSYEDLSNYLSEPIGDYDYELVGQEQVLDRMAYNIIATPKSKTKTQYSKRELWIDTKTYLLTKCEFYNSKGKLNKRYIAKNIKPIKGTDYSRAHFVSLQNLLTNNTTEVYYDDFSINKGVDKSMFSRSYIETL